MPDLRVDLQGPLDAVPQTGLHGLLHVPQPVLHVPVGPHGPHQLHLLSLPGVHVADLEVGLELQLGRGEGGVIMLLALQEAQQHQSCLQGPTRAMFSKHLRR